MHLFTTWFYYRMKAFKRFYDIKKHDTSKKYAHNLKLYAGKKLNSCEEINKYIINKIDSGEPFLVGRFGSTELLNIQSYDFGSYGKYRTQERFSQLCKWSGFFPEDISLLQCFVDEIKESAKELDVLACWFHPFEDYYIKHTLKKDVLLTYLLDFEPWAGKVHWSKALSNKKVLVIHPFDETIRRQYQNREKIFPNTDILPQFELKTLKAVQTLAGTNDSRFSTWFDALDWMYQEAIKIDFDIAIIGCGAYGLPLAARIKRFGKQAIHLAGATQLLFGIRGKRWDNGEDFEYVRDWYNDSWIYPDDCDRITNAEKVENACYW